jgi:4-carboxymuconolactone decarboxylase
MSEQDPKQQEQSERPYARAVPKLAQLGADVLYGDVWERPELSKRDRSLITVAALTAMYRPQQLPAHIKRAIDNGVTRDEIAELIAHVAFYAGWPAAVSSAELFGTVLDELDLR